MISNEKLKAIKTVISHDNCPDGTASAIILHDALPNAEIRYVQYGSDAHKYLPATEGMLFCDFSPPADRAAEFVAAGAIVLDHHKTAKSVVELFGENGVFADESADPGVCGAVLAYRHVWKPMHLDRESDTSQGMRKQNPELEPFIDQLATLAGIRDTWQRRDHRWAAACVQASVLAFIPNKVWLSYPLTYTQAHWNDHFRPLGQLLVEKQDKDVVRICEKGWHFSTEQGTRIIVIPSKGLTSDAAEYLDDKVDLVAGFGYTFEPGMDRPLLIVSTRSHTNFDCATFCKRYGGGGHTKAAGCSFAVEEEQPNPYTFIETLIRDYDNGRAIRGEIPASSNAGKMAL